MDFVGYDQDCPCQGGIPVVIEEPVYVYNKQTIIDQIFGGFLKYSMKQLGAFLSMFIVPISADFYTNKP